MSAVMWFRRDLRLADSPALLAAAAEGEVLPWFVLDPALWGPAGVSRQHHAAERREAIARWERTRQ